MLLKNSSSQVTQPVSFAALETGKRKGKKLSTRWIDRPKGRSGQSLEVRKGDSLLFHFSEKIDCPFFYSPSRELANLSGHMGPPQPGTQFSPTGHIATKTYASSGTLLMWS